MCSILEAIFLPLFLLLQLDREVEEINSCKRAAQLLHAPQLEEDPRVWLSCASQQLYVAYVMLSQLARVHESLRTARVRL